MRVRLQNRGTLERGTVSVWSNEDRSVEVQLSVMAKNENGQEVFPDGSTLPNEIEVSVDFGIPKVRVPEFESFKDVMEQLGPDEFRRQLEKLVREYNPGRRDRSGIAADDDPYLRGEPHPTLGYIPPLQPNAQAPKCQGCNEPSWYLKPLDVVSTTDKTRATLNLCEGCTEIAENADPETGSYGAAAAEWVSVRGIQK